MFSEGPRLSPVGRCLFCSLGCRLQVEEFAPQRWRPVYGGRDDGRLCVRGQMVADLLHSPQRLYRPRGPAGPETLAAALAGLAGALSQAARDGKYLEVWLEGNAAVEDLAAARQFCGQWPGRSRLLVHVPPPEAGALEGLDAAGAAPAAPAEWADADALLVIGNPLVTHPPVAPHLLRWGQKRAQTPLVVIDSAAGLPAGYTSHALLCRPGYEYWLTAALLRAAGLNKADGWLPDGTVVQQVVKDSGVDQEHVDRAAQQLRLARRPAVVVAPQSGGAERWRALTALAAAWAAQQGGMISVLTGSANALAATRYMRRYGLENWALAGPDAKADESKVLLIIGWDPSSAYPRSLWEPRLASAEQVVLAAAFPPAAAERMDWIMPLALGSEVGGTYLLADGRPVRVDGLMPPPAGVPSIRGLFHQIGTNLAASGAAAMGLDQPSVSDEDCSASGPQSAGQTPAPPSAAMPDGWPVVLIADPMQYFDGQITRCGRWSRVLNLPPQLWVSPADARALKLVHGQRARIINERGQAEVCVAISKDQPRLGGCYAEDAPGTDGRSTGWLAVSGGSAEVRQLAGWQFHPGNESAQAGTIHVRVEPGETSGQSGEFAGEAAYACT